MTGAKQLIYLISTSMSKNFDATADRPDVLLLKVNNFTELRQSIFMIYQDKNKTIPLSYPDIGKIKIF